MDEGEVRKKLIALFEEKENIEKKIEKLQNYLVQQLCPKRKQSCEPEYCTYRITNTCPFIKEWRKILEEADVPKDTKYDLFVDFVEKILEDKDFSKSTP